MAMFALAIGNFLTLSRARQQERNMDGWVTKSEGYSRGEGEVLRVEDLTVQYGALVALSDVSWSVHAGEILGIIGPNGAGKSSCFAAVTNEVTHSGRIFLDDNDVSQTRTYDLASYGLRRTFQHNSFFGELTVLQNAVAAIVRDFSAVALSGVNVSVPPGKWSGLLAQMAPANRHSSTPWRAGRVAGPL
jgi:ABC-type molybdenum transport system ATPase subunit/photorepair protein PhrA